MIAMVNIHQNSWRMIIIRQSRPFEQTSLRPYMHLNLELWGGLLIGTGCLLGTIRYVVATHQVAHWSDIYNNMASQFKISSNPTCKILSYNFETLFYLLWLLSSTMCNMILSKSLHDLCAILSKKQVFYFVTLIKTLKNFYCILNVL